MSDVHTSFAVQYFGEDNLDEEDNLRMDFSELFEDCLNIEKKVENGIYFFKSNLFPLNI